MELNDVMRLQEYLVNAADEYIDGGGKVGFMHPAITPMGAAFVMFTSTLPTNISREYCKANRDALEEALGIPFTLNVLKNFWSGFDGDKKPQFTLKQRYNDNLDFIFEIGSFLRHKYDPIDDGEE